MIIKLFKNKEGNKTVTVTNAPARKHKKYTIRYKRDISAKHRHISEGYVETEERAIELAQKWVGKNGR